MDKDYRPEIPQMDSQSIFNLFLQIEIKDNEECKETISLIWKQLRLLVTKKQCQDEVRQFLQQSNCFKSILQKVISINEANILHQSNIDSFFFQFMANFITGNEQNQSFMAEEIFSKDETYYLLFKKVYDSFSFRDSKLRKFICTFLYNFLKAQKVEVVMKNIMNSLSFQHILKGVLVEFLENKNESDINIQEQATQQIQAQSQEVQVIYWTLLLISHLFNLSQNQSFSIIQYLEILFVSEEGVYVEQKNETYLFKCKGKEYNLYELVSNSLFEKFQLFLYHISQKFIDEKVNNSFVKGLEPTIIDVRCQYVNKSDYQFQLNTNDLDYITTQFKNIHQSIYNLLDAKKAFELVDPQDLDDEEKLLFTNHLIQIHDKIRVFCNLTFLGAYNSQIQKKIFDNGLFEEVLKLNQNLQKLNSLSFDRSQALINSKKQCLLYFSAESYQDIFSNIMRFLSNVVHINREAQDYILQNGYLLSCLNQTYMDETNPLQREWSVMLIRNLCDSNDEMQSAISNLKMFEFSDRTKEILQKYQAKKEELEQIRQSMKDGTIQKELTKICEEKKNEDFDDFI
ncbi:spinocerebellar ataxia type 10 domain protein (macronuclear) [Tetrahymena thermophila SB210]|uniref:Spinocerebellar ataxia type 10 domain protein n=1 Tax=Tetrahymena thermophila (strain SB210) TaxID=312017 RepID=I7M0Y0_TETTS|nr:spinocerebellar ataxia type 10 domain protein [Tetrahymena thermophila SB210]EAR92917.2 spinocerebellar ataxia type 10 domain protein [Tetrahymena thermophila SB210]|eukprot:XP_001013162.2 spinocerebellar ataxia type 10 domain protein [Tetrahymena thermophila SB210]